jgi:microcystin-dependent protein
MFPIQPLHKLLITIGLPSLALATLPPLSQQRVPVQPIQAAPSAGSADTQSAVAIISGRLPAGTILAYAGEDPPAGYLLCDGTEVLRDDYPALFGAIGTAWGFDTAFTFTLPDLRGRFLRGIDGTAGNDPDANSRGAIHLGGNVGNAVGSLQEDGRRGFSGTFGGTTSTAGSHSHDILTRQDDWDEDDGDGSSRDPGWADDARSPVPWNDWHATESAGSHSHSFSVNVNFTGQNETRPKNVYVTFIIKT